MLRTKTDVANAAFTATMLEIATKIDAAPTIPHCFVLFYYYDYMALHTKDNSELQKAELFLDVIDHVNYLWGSIKDMDAAAYDRKIQHWQGVILGLEEWAADELLARTDFINTVTDDLFLRGVMFLLMAELPIFDPGANHAS
jgi:hypothetical protein